MKKLIFCNIVMVLLFFFRDGLNEYWIENFSKEADKSSWLVNRHNSISNDLSVSGFSIAIEHLITFDNKIQKELQRIKSDSTKSSHKYRRKLICELPVVYKEMAMLYLQKGDNERYMKFIRKSQAELADCVNLKEYDN